MQQQPDQTDFQHLGQASRTLDSARHYCICTAMSAIQTENLTRLFSANQGVRELCLSVPARAIYGFLGPNGAGKTTTIRLLLGLIRPHAGAIRFFGQAPATVQHQVQALIESPSLYGHLSALDNLEVTRRLINAPKSRVLAALARVGLSEYAHQRVREFSLGMRQRLGLALTLLNQPRLLILDEPTNGLDPAGIVQMRQLLRSLVEDDGVSIFMSSHLLSEVEQMADHVGVLQAGRKLFEGKVAALRAQAPAQLHLHCDQPERASALLQQWQVQALTDASAADHAHFVLSGQIDSAELNRSLHANGIGVRQIYWRAASLEDLFFRLTEPSR